MNRTPGKVAIEAAPPVRPRQTELKLDWASEVSDDEWRMYQQAMRAVRGAGVEFMLGGGFAQASFTGRWRNTKDIDFYVLPQHRERAVQALTQAGFVDYYPTLAYDRRWIYRSTKADVLVDIIWAMANQRAQVDELWFDRADSLRVRDEQLLVMPIEEFMWCKLYIVQRDRCDWIDILNLLFSNGPFIDWDHLIWRLEGDLPLLVSVLHLYGWLHPERASLLPQALRDRLMLPLPRAEDAARWQERARFLDSRIWFTAFKPRGERLEI
jgi:hypothetical protein